MEDGVDQRALLVVSRPFVLNLERVDGVCFRPKTVGCWVRMALKTSPVLVEERHA
jgi:hypothetical protein